MFSALVIIKQDLIPGYSMCKPAPDLRALNCEWRKLQVWHPWGELRLKGQMTFQDYYPMQFELQGLSKVPWLDKQLVGRQARLSAVGPLTDLQTKLVVEGTAGDSSSHLPM